MDCYLRATQNIKPAYFHTTGFDHTTLSPPRPARDHVTAAAGVVPLSKPLRNELTETHLAAASTSAPTATTSSDLHMSTTTSCIQAYRRHCGWRMKCKICKTVGQGASERPIEEATTVAAASLRNTIPTHPTTQQTRLPCPRHQSCISALHCYGFGRR